ncbi:relaxase/mobilization nuclease domain-containing protein [Helicobacter suis]|nr:relaxase/mobilization nuclease domain-containing protein [Helicobacter suis]
MDLEEEPLFDYVKVHQRKTPKSKKTYIEFFHQAIVDYTKNLITSTTRSKRKQVVIKNIANMTTGHLQRALDYLLKKSEDQTVVDEFFATVKAEEVLEQWREDFRSSKSRAKNVAMHLVFSIDEPINKRNLQILESSVYQTLIDSLGYNYAFILKVHSHQNKPHVHVLLNKTHKFTGKKLRFTSKTDCKEFFHSMREDFKNHLFINSNAELEYSNTPNIEKHLRSIEKELEEIQKMASNNNTLQASAFFDQVCVNLDRNIVAMQKQKQALLKQQAKMQQEFEKEDPKFFHFIKHLKPEHVKRNIKGSQRAIKIVSAKIQFANKVQHKYLKQQKELLQRENRFLKNAFKIDKLDQQIHLLGKDLDQFLDHENNFTKWIAGYSLLSQKRQLLASLKSMSSGYGSNRLAKNLEMLQREIRNDQAHFKDDIFALNRFLDFQSLSGLKKASVFFLNKRINRCQSISKIVENELKHTTAQQDGWPALQALLDQRRVEALDLIEKRKFFLKKRFIELQQNYNHLKSEYNQALFDPNKSKESQALFKQLNRITRNLAFMAKEIKLAQHIKQTQGKEQTKEKQHKVLQESQEKELPNTTKTNNKLSSISANKQHTKTSNHRRKDGGSGYTRALEGF